MLCDAIILTPEELNIFRVRLVADSRPLDPLEHDVDTGDRHHTPPHLSRATLDASWMLWQD